MHAAGQDYRTTLTVAERDGDPHPHPSTTTLRRMHIAHCTLHTLRRGSASVCTGGRSLLLSVLVHADPPAGCLCWWWRWWWCLAHLAPRTSQLATYRARLRLRLRQIVALCCARRPLAVPAASSRMRNLAGCCTPRLVRENLRCPFPVPSGSAVASLSGAASGRIWRCSSSPFRPRKRRKATASITISCLQPSMHPLPISLVCFVRHCPSIAPCHSPVPRRPFPPPLEPQGPSSNSRLTPQPYALFPRSSARRISTLLPSR
jgi:hypothetical protein